jgi:chaperonin cofactor prefoldin
MFKSCPRYQTFQGVAASAVTPFSFSRTGAGSGEFWSRCISSVGFRRLLSQVDLADHCFVLWKRKSVKENVDRFWNLCHFIVNKNNPTEMMNMVVGKSAATKEDLKKFKEEIVHQFHVISEDVISQVKQVAKGVVNLDEKLDRRFIELRTEIDDKTQPITQAVLELSGKVANLDDRVASLDGRVANLDGKVVTLDGKVDKIHQELKTEIRETRQEVLAAVKFSYAELDKRITTLEKDFLDLKHRVERIESRSIP